MDKKKFLEKNYIIVIILIWLFSICVFFLISNFSKRIETVCDEIYYMEIAKSIFVGDGIKVHGINAGFQKILYPLVIAPFFGITNNSLRITIISLFNCVLMTSAIFPIFLIAKKIIIDYKKILIICLLSVFMPSISFTLTFMSEIIFYPLMVWFIYFWIESRNKDNFIYPIFLGIFSYLLYLTKETSLIILLSMIMFEILNPVIKKLVLKERVNIKEIFSRTKIIKIVLVFVPFLVLFLVLKFTIFANIGSIYWSSSFFENVNSFYKFGYFIYSTIYYFISILFAVLFLPILFPLFSYKRINKNSQNLFFLLLIIAFIASIIIAFKISTVEDLGEIAPRIHLRYIFPIFPLFFLIFISTYEQNKNFTHIKLNRKLIIACVIFFLFSSFYFKGIKLGSAVDQYDLFYYYIIQTNLKAKISNNVIYYFLITMLNLIICSIAFTIIIMYSCNKHKIKLSCAIYSSFTLIFFVTSSIFSGKLIRNAYSISKNEINIINEIQLENNTNALFILKKENYKIRPLCTYLNYSNKINYIYTEANTLEGELVSHKQNKIPVNFICFNDILLNAKYSNIDKIDYVIFENEAKFENIKFLNLELVKVTSNNLYTIYRNTNMNFISFITL